MSAHSHISSLIFLQFNAVDLKHFFPHIKFCLWKAWHFTLRHCMPALREASEKYCIKFAKWRNFADFYNKLSHCCSLAD